jgi:hypothetical protein
MGGWIARSPSIGEGKNRKRRFGTWDLALGMIGSDIQLLERRKVLLNHMISSLVMDLFFTMQILAKTMA